MSTCPKCGAPIPPQDSIEKKCEFCGGISIIEKEPITKNSSVVEEETTQTGNGCTVKNVGCALFVISLVFPLIVVLLPISGIVSLLKFIFRIKK